LGPTPKSPIPNPQSPIPNISKKFQNYKKIKNLKKLNFII